MTERWLVPDSDLVPDDVQSELIMIRSKLTENYFRIGDIANRLVLEAIKSKSGVRASRIHKAVARFAGKSGRTVRYYAENAAFYSNTGRQLWHYLPFSFFDFARGFGDKYTDVLELAADNPGCTLAWLRTEYLMEKKGQDNPDREIAPGSGAFMTGNGIDGRIVFTDENRCVQTDLSEGEQSGVRAYAPLAPVGVSQQTGVTAAQFHFVQEIQHILDRADLAIAMADHDTRVPTRLRQSLKHNYRALGLDLSEFAKCMDKPKVEQMVCNPKVDTVG